MREKLQGGIVEASNPVAELLSRTISEKLWHYASIQGVRGVVTSKRIVATDLRFLNDRAEFTPAIEIAKEAVEKHPREA
jgi:hypothetical protein